MAASHHCVARSCRHASLAYGSSSTPTIGRRDLLGLRSNFVRLVARAPRSILSRSRSASLSVRSASATSSAPSGSGTLFSASLHHSLLNLCVRQGDACPHQQVSSQLDRERLSRSARSALVHVSPSSPRPEGLVGRSRRLRATRRLPTRDSSSASALHLLQWAGSQEALELRRSSAPYGLPRRVRGALVA